MLWTQDALWAKARTYMVRALGEDRDGAEFPFHASLALEFLARAAVASKHPALLADPSDANNLLYAFGLEPKPKDTTKKFTPKSIPAHTVFSRCRLIANAFGADDEELCLALANRRNEELHSGGLAFAEFPTRVWLARFYRAVKKLLEAQGKSLTDFLGSADATAAEGMIHKADDKLIGEVKSLIAKHAKLFRDKHGDEQTSLQADAVQYVSFTLGRQVFCPACKCPALVQGQRVKSQPTVLEDDVIIEQDVYLPTSFDCAGCGLRLTSHAALEVVDLGGQYTTRTESDAVAYFGGDSADDYGDYGND